MEKSNILIKGGGERKEEGREETGERGGGEERGEQGRT